MSRHVLQMPSGATATITFDAERRAMGQAAIRIVEWKGNRLDSDFPAYKAFVLDIVSAEAVRSQKRILYAFPKGSHNLRDEFWYCEPDGTRHA